MQFRQQPGRRRIEVLSYREDRPVLIGSIDPSSGAFKASRTNHGPLSLPEQRELDGFIADLKKKNAHASVAALPDTISQISSHIKEDPEAGQHLDTKALDRALPGLKKALEKAGVKSKKKKSPADYKPIKGERILFEADAPDEKPE